MLRTSFYEAQNDARHHNRLYYFWASCTFIYFLFDLDKIYWTLLIRQVDILNITSSDAAYANDNER